MLVLLFIDLLSVDFFVAVVIVVYVNSQISFPWLIFLKQDDRNIPA